MTDPRLGREVYLGPWGHPDTKTIYRRWVEDYGRGGPPPLVHLWIAEQRLRTRVCENGELAALLLAEAAARVLADLGSAGPCEEVASALGELTEALERLDSAREG